MRPNVLSRRAFLTAAAGFAIGGCASLTRSTTKRPPNFVVIFTDDQGYNDLGCFGSPKIKTPRIDRMAREGAIFTDFYVAAPVCSASRAALLTGCYPQRVNIPGVLFPGMRTGLNLKEITIAEVLRDQGYATACIGKWHLGHLPEFLPMHQGFDYFYGLPYSNDMTPSPLYRNNDIIEEPAYQPTLTKRYTEQAIDFIKQHRDEPFFVYLPHAMPHVPLHASEKFLGTSERGLYGDTIEEIDWSTGQILDLLQQEGLADNTLVIFTSDNGPWLQYGDDGGSAYPLRDGKGTAYEGGMRVPCVMWWPGTIPRGTICKEVAATIDFMPTFARLAGGHAPRDRRIDGKDIRPLIYGTPGAKSPHKAFYYYSGFHLKAVRSGKWKLWFVNNDPENAVELYDLCADIGEQHNVAQQHPDVVARLTRYAAHMRKDLGDAGRHMKGKHRRPPGVPRS